MISLTVRRANRANRIHSLRTTSLRLSLSTLALLAIPVMGHAANRMVPSMYPNVQAAINAAVNGDTIILANGIYRGAGNVNLDTLGKAITIKSTQGTGSCIIDGSYGSQLLTIHSGETGATKIQNITFRHGVTYGNGGAIAITNSSPAISGCVFEANYAINSNGGAIIVSQGAPTISNCTFIFNDSPSGYGGAMFLLGDKTTINNCTFDTNVASYGGGGLYAGSSSTAKVNNSFFTSNSAATGGGAAVISATTAFTNCTFSTNKASDRGGAINAYNSTSKLTTCDFDSNSAVNAGGALALDASANLGVSNGCFVNNSSYEGGAVFINGASPTISGSEFDNNASTSGVRFLGGGAVFVTTIAGGSSPMINECTFSYNVATDGGAIDNSSGAVTVKDSVFDRNSAYSDGGAVITTAGNLTCVNDVFTYNAGVNGGAVSLESGDAASLYVLNCSTYGNYASNVGNGLYLGGAGYSAIVTNSILWDVQSGQDIYDSLGAATVSYSDTYNVWTGAGTHNFVSDPLYTDPTNGNLLPKLGSLCDNNGNPKAPGFPRTDIQGVVRSTKTPDIGAYEF